jgi:hypothetical protein
MHVGPLMCKIRQNHMAVAEPPSKVFGGGSATPNHYGVVWPLTLGVEVAKLLFILFLVLFFCFFFLFFWRKYTLAP